MTILNTHQNRVLPALRLALAGVFGLLLCLSTAAAQDFSRAYQYGGGVSIPAPDTNSGRPVFESNTTVNAKGVLGCEGLSLEGMIDRQMGGMNISDLSKELADAAKTIMFRETITRVLANPQVASVLENMKGFAHARISLLQKRCNANEIYADATNKRLRADAMKRCVDSEQNMEVCQDTEKLTEYLEETLEDEKWSGTLHQQLCEGQDCDWLTLIPNYVVDPTGDRDDNSTPALMEGRDMTNMATGFAVEIINERVRAASDFISWFGYSSAMEAALHNEPGLPEEILEEIERDGSDFDGSALYTLYDHTSSEACSASAEKGISYVDMAPVMTPDGGGEFPIAGAGPANADISSLFGPRVRPCRGCSKFHSGIDFAYPTGTPVVSSVDGVVRQATFGTCGGNQVVIEGEDGTVLTHLHLDAIGQGISPGAPVSAGTAIGTVGSTGTCTTGPHLHFKVVQRGKVVDPFGWLGINENALERALSEEDGHGLETLAVARSDEEPDSDFVIDNYKKSAQLAARMANTVLCNINQNLHPQVFVKLATLPGTVGPESRGDIVDENATEREIFNAIAKGEKGTAIHGLGGVFGHYAAVTTYNAAIDEMTMKLVTEGKDMNATLYKRARGELGRLKMQRFSMLNTYKSNCEFATDVEKIMKDIEEKIEKANNPRRYRQQKQLRTVNNKPFRCDMFSDITDDGINDIAQAQQTDEDVEKSRRHRPR